MKLFTCTDHDGHWPVGVASVVVAETSVQAAAMLDAKLKEHGLKVGPEKPYTLKEYEIIGPFALLLNDGDY